MQHVGKEISAVQKWRETETIQACLGLAGIAHWLERWTRDRKILGSSPRGSGGRIFFSMVNFLCLLLFQYPFHSHFNKRSWSFCQKCRWQVTAKHARTLPMWLWMKWPCKLVHGCMVHTERAPRRQLFHVAPATEQPIFKNKTKNAIKKIQSLIENHMRHERRDSAREQRIVYESDH